LKPPFLFYHLKNLKHETVIGHPVRINAGFFMQQYLRPEGKKNA
jgi:hypothetical protein